MTATRRLAAVLVGLLAVAVLASACGGEGGQAASPKLKPNPTPMRTDDSTILFGVNAEANGAHAAVTATVTAVAPPMNTSFTTQSQQVVAKVIQDVTITVDQVIFDSATAMTAEGKDATWTGPALAAGASIVVAADQTGDAVDIPGRSTIKQNERTGPFAVGDKVVLLLRRFYGFPGPNGTRRTAYTVLDGWQGHWIIDRGGATAHNPDGRSVAVQAYIQRLQQERQIGRHPERDPGTKDDPTAPVS